MDIIGYLVDPPKETSWAALSLAPLSVFNGLVETQGSDRSYHVGCEQRTVMRYLRVEDCSPGIGHAITFTETKEEILLEIFCGISADTPADFLSGYLTECVARMRVSKKRGDPGECPSIVFSIPETASIFDGQKCVVGWMRSAFECFKNQIGMVVVDERALSLFN